MFGDNTMHLCKNLGPITALAACLLVNPAVQAQEGPLMVRGRLLLIDPVHNSSSIGALAVPPDAIQVKKRWVPELDFTYFLSKNLAAELVLAYTKLDVRVTSSAVGAFDAGSFYALPPTLTLQWHFLPDGDIRPYVGAGINYTRISKVRLSVPAVTPLDLERNSVGLAVQAGLDVKLRGPWYLNLDVKKVQIRADLKDGAGAKLSTVKADPWLFGAGMGYRF